MPEATAAHLLEAVELDTERTEASLDLFLLEALLKEVRPVRDGEGAWQLMLRQLPESIMGVLMTKITVARSHVSIRTAPDTDPEYHYPQYLVHRCRKHAEPPGPDDEARCACEWEDGDERMYLVRTPVVADAYTPGTGRNTWSRIRPMLREPRPEPREITLAEYNMLAYARTWIHANDPLLSAWLAGEDSR